jgi:hypothetical protein
MYVHIAADSNNGLPSITAAGTFPNGCIFLSSSLPITSRPETDS